MATRSLDDLETRIDALGERIDRQGKLIERITATLYDVVEAIRVREERGPTSAEAHEQPAEAGGAPVIHLGEYTRVRASGEC